MARFACIAAALVLGLVAGCAEGGINTQTAPAAEWAEGLCSAITTYKQSLSSAADQLTGGMLSTRPDLTVSNVKSATKTFTNDLNDLGRPDNKAGEQANDAADELADSLELYANEMESDVRDSTGLFSDPTESVRATLGLMVDEVSNTFKKIERFDANGELANAFEQAESCVSLRSQ